MATNSLSFENLTNASTNPNINTKGSVTLIKLGIIKKDNCIISVAFIWRLFITLKSLDNWSNQAIETNIKKISVQELTIWLNMYQFILFILWLIILIILSNLTKNIRNL